MAFLWNAIGAMGGAEGGASIGEVLKGVGQLNSINNSLSANPNPAIAQTAAYQQIADQLKPKTGANSQAAAQVSDDMKQRIGQQTLPTTFGYTTPDWSKFANLTSQLPGSTPTSLTNTDWLGLFK